MAVFWKKQSLAIAFVLAAMAGAVLGLGGYTFVYAKGYSYLGNNPEACANCHVMQDYYSAWLTGSHRQVAACNDCHAPHDLAGKLAVKAINGFHHSLAFTTGDYPANIHIRDFNRAVTEGACRSCHAEIVSAISGHQGEDVACVRCHFSVGHGAAAFVPPVSAQSQPMDGTQLLRDEKTWLR